MLYSHDEGVPLVLLRLGVLRVPIRVGILRWLRQVMKMYNGFRNRQPCKSGSPASSMVSRSK